MEENNEDSMSFIKIAITVVIAVIVISTVAIPVIHDMTAQGGEEYTNVGQTLSSGFYAKDLNMVDGDFEITVSGTNIVVKYNGKEETIPLSESNKIMDSPIVFSNDWAVKRAYGSSQQFIISAQGTGYGYVSTFEVKRTNGEVDLKFTDRVGEQHITFTDKGTVFLASNDGKYVSAHTVGAYEGNTPYVLYINETTGAIAGYYHNGKDTTPDKEIIVTENVTEIEDYEYIQQYAYTVKLKTGNTETTLANYVVMEKNVVYVEPSTTNTILNIIPVFMVLGVLGLIVGFIRTGKDEEEAVTYDYER